MEAHGSPLAEAAQKALALLPKKVQGAVMTKAGIDRLDALYTGIESVRRGGTISVSGVYGGAADPLPMMQLFDKQLQIRMGQANVRRGPTTSSRCSTRTRTSSVPRHFATHHLPLDEAPDAYQKFQAKEDGYVKVVFRP